MAALDDWRRTTLEELSDGKSGLKTGPFGSELAASDYTPEGVPVIMPRDLVDGVVSTAKIKYISAEKAAELERYRLRPGDLLFARRGEIGRCALITEREEGWLVGTGCLRARLGAAARPEFLIQLLAWPATVVWLSDNSVGQTMQNLSTKIFRKLPLRVPPLAIQDRIVELLASVDTAVAAQRQVIEQRHKVKRGSVAHLLRHGTARAFDTAERGFPAGWKLRPIGELSAFINGHAFRVDDRAPEGLPIIRIQNLNGNQDFNYFAGPPKPAWLVEPGELLFAWAGTKGVSFGPYFWPGPRGVLNQHIFRVAPHDQVDRHWLYEGLRQVTRSLEERAQGFKATLQHLRKPDLMEYPILVPPFDEQRAIAKRVAVLDEIEDLEQSHLERLLHLKRALMHDIFSGRVGIPASGHEDILSAREDGAP